MDICYK